MALSIQGLVLMFLSVKTNELGEGIGFLLEVGKFGAVLLNDAIGLVQGVGKLDTEVFSRFAIFFSSGEHGC